MNKLAIRTWGLAAAGLVAASAFAGPENVIVKDGQTFAFMGDSITQGGGQAPNGYCHLVMDGLKRAGVKNLKSVMAGLSGDNAPKMNARVDKAVFRHKPDWMTLSCGVNDVWWRGQMTIDTYKTNIKAILDRAEAANIKVIILTATMIHGKSKNDSMIDEQRVYNAFLKEEAAKRKLPVVDLFAAEEKYMNARAADPSLPALKRDGVHMNVYGNHFMAKEILRGLGVGEDVIAAAQKDWMDLPGAFTVSEVWGFMTPAECAVIYPRAIEGVRDLGGNPVGRNVDKLLRKLVIEKIKND